MAGGLDDRGPRTKRAVPTTGMPGRQDEVTTMIEPPFPVAISDYADQVDRSCVQWSERLGVYPPELRERYRGIKVGVLAACICPRGTLPGLRLLADWQMLLFSFDDAFCDESDLGADPTLLVRRATRFMRILESREPPGDDPLCHAMADLSDRLRAMASDVQYARFAATVRAYLLALCWEATHRAAGTLPDIGEYVDMRRESGAVRTCTAVTDVAGGFELDAGTYHDSAVVAVTDMALNVVCWANDILSYPKEVRQSTVVCSLPVLVARHRDLDIDAGLAAAATMHDREIARYVTAEARLRTHASPALQRYLDDLRHWMSGNVYWSRRSGRYAEVSGVPG